MPTQDLCKEPFVIDLTQGLLETQSTAKQGDSPQILSLSTLEITPASELPTIPVCDPDLFNTTFEFRDVSFSCVGDSLNGSINIIISPTTPIQDDSVVTVEMSIPGCRLISANPNLVVDDINVTQFRIVSAASFTSPATLQLRVPNAGCGALDVTGSITGITPVAFGWEIGTVTPDTLNFH